jgi:hypothetical protein
MAQLYPSVHCIHEAACRCDVPEMRFLIVPARRAGAGMECLPVYCASHVVVGLYMRVCVE